MGEVLVHEMNLIMEKITDPDANLSINAKDAIRTKPDGHMSRRMRNWVDIGALCS